MSSPQMMRMFGFFCGCSSKLSLHQLFLLSTTPGRTVGWRSTLRRRSIQAPLPEAGVVNDDEEYVRRALHWSQLKRKFLFIVGFWVPSPLAGEGQDGGSLPGCGFSPPPASSPVKGEERNRTAERLKL